MTVWILFVWMQATTEMPSVWQFESKAECMRSAVGYRWAVCKPVTVERPK